MSVPSDAPTALEGSKHSSSYSYPAAAETDEGRPGDKTDTQCKNDDDSQNGSDGDDDLSDDEKSKAARVLQKNYRGHQARSQAVSSKARWDQLLSDSQAVHDEKGAQDGQNDAGSRWHRALHASSKITNGHGTEANDEGSGGQDEEVGEEKKAKTLPIKDKNLEESYWLEMVDGRHRYGANLKYYHAKWEEADTTGSFFRWLDHGAGKKEDLPECPRSQLEKERVQYLNMEQRLNYLCRVDRKTGKLYWHVRGEPVDTSPNTWEDRGDGQGIVRREEPDSDARPSSPSGSSSSSLFDHSASSSDSSLEENEATHYAGAANEDTGGIKGRWKKLTNMFSTKGVGERMLRKTVKKNTWIFVADVDYHLFVGLKKTGTFQHSSFLGGGRVTAAGLIVVKNGLIKSLSPLSGHYKTSIDHYKTFLRQLEDQGADLSKVKVTGAEMTLLGLEKYGKFSKKRKSLTHKIFHPQAHKEEAAEEEYEHASPSEREKLDGHDRNPQSDGQAGEGGGRDQGKKGAQGGRDEFMRVLLMGRKKQDEPSATNGHGHRPSKDTMEAENGDKVETVHSVNDKDKDEKDQSRTTPPTQEQQHASAPPSESTPTPKTTLTDSYPTSGLENLSLGTPIL
ncbi:IQ motif, EF-hand binding site [Phaffia rhodozyma]|uniref:IQ motif, EF-hand binding site n=1 Tax=Phaffia rhodozyma TaxID=264483 RepID=A0A0F7SRY8_PHARH|nr:IQ motif, EF-hand binding site [Phaffia rhodozyma]